LKCYEMQFSMFNYPVPCTHFYSSFVFARLEPCFQPDEGKEPSPSSLASFVRYAERGYYLKFLSD
jgi:hypothetical protein